MQRHKAAIHGLDTGNLPTGVVANRDRDLSSEPSQNLVTYTDVVDVVVAEVSRRGYMMAPNILGEWGGFKVYKEMGFSERGLNMPNTWKRYKTLTPGTIGAKGFLEHLRDIIEHILANDDDYTKEFKDKSIKWFLSVAERPSDAKSVARLSSAADTSEETVYSTLSGKASKCHKWLPPIDSFSAEIQQLNPLDLLTVFPTAEAQIFMLGLGKMLAGVSGAKHVETSLEYRSRAIFHIMESTGGVGKSWLLDNLLPETLKELGYNTSTIDQRMERFSTIHWCPSDYAILDDATDATLIKVLSSSTMKSVATNSSIFAEAKGIQGRDIVCTTTPFIASNCSNIYALYERMDSAQLSRHIPIQVYNSKELELRYGDEWRQYRLPERWATLAKQYQCSEQVLMMWLLRNSLDYFLDCVGYDPATMLQNKDSYRLETEFETLRSQLRVKTSLSHREELVDGLAQLVALSIAKSPFSEQLVDKVDDLTLHSDWLCTLLQCWLKDKDTYGESLEAMKLPSLSTGVISQIKNQLQDFKDMAQTKPQPAVWDAIAERLISKTLVQYGTSKGGTSTTMQYYSGLWSNVARTTLALYIEKYKAMSAKDIPPYTMTVITGFSAKLLNIDGL